MPRATQSQAAKIIKFFQTATIEVAEFAAEQVLDILRERRAKSKAAKERAKGLQTVGGPAPAVAAVPKPVAVRRKAKPVKKSHKKIPRPAVNLAPDPRVPEMEDAEAGDLIGSTR